MEFAFEIAGKRLQPYEITNAHDAAVAEEVIDTFSGRLAGLSCPQHQQEPKIIFRGSSFDDLKLEIVGCCDSLVAQVQRRLTC